MNTPSLCAALALLTVLAQAARSGVGFSLSHNYAVASVVYEDGSIYDIAKIAGLRTYRRAMDAIILPDYLQIVPPEPRALWDPELTCGTESSGLYEPIPQAPLGLQESYDRLPTWLGGYERDEATKALTAMLRALKAATEAALGSEIEQAYIAVPFPVTEDFNRRLRLASSAVGLGFPGFAVSAATVVGRGTRRNCSVELSNPEVRKPKSEIVVVVDLNNYAMTATLATVSCASFEIRSLLSSDKYGAWELANPFRRDVDQERYPESELQRQQRYKLKKDLWKDAINRLAWLGRSDNIAVPGIERLIFIGESSTDALQRTFRKRFGKRLETFTEPGSDGYVDNADRAYTVARKMARHALNKEMFSPET